MPQAISHQNTDALLHTLHTVREQRSLRLVEGPATGPGKSLIDRVRTLHRQAMNHAEEGDLERFRGNLGEAQTSYDEAFRLERQAAMLLADWKDLEPTRSVLFRSAATLALECGDDESAEELIQKALEGHPPAEILAELEELRSSYRPDTDHEPDSLLPLVEEIEEFMQAALERLPEPERSLLIQHYGLSDEETAACVDPEESQLSAARLRFNSLLQEELERGLEAETPLYPALRFLQGMQ